jgi:transglutaminase-like putative cysteine protease
MITSVRVGTVMTWSCAGAGSALLAVRVAQTTDQTIVDENLVADGARLEFGPAGSLGDRPVRIHVDGGSFCVRYAAGVDVNPGSRPCPRDDVALPTASELEFGLLRWTLPSRFCPSDALGPTAESTFGELPRTRRLIPTVADWVRDQVAYTPGASNHLTTADQTLLAREGVCRDLTHLAVSFLRALEVPARMVAAYAPGLKPPDFHALLEAHDGTAWRLVDVTGLAPVETLVRIATGRDAADVAWANTSGAFVLSDVAVTAEAVSPSSHASPDQGVGA